jgi:bifunctional DNA-binding transcriptional regulator/antitoxin component of YhaV-PrlF toxin-antitoxin module
MDSQSQNEPVALKRFDGTYYMRIGKNGRATLPKPVRQLLAVDENMEVEVRIENGHITIPGRLPTLEELAGSLPPLPEGVDVEELVKQAKAEHYTGSHA